MRQRHQLRRQEPRLREADAKAAEADLRAERAHQELSRVCEELGDMIAQHDALLQSTTWKATWLVRSVGSRLPPPLRRALRRCAKLMWWTAMFKLLHKLRDRYSSSRGP